MKSMILVICLAAAWPAAAQQQPPPLKGTVKQTMDAGPYTYILVASDKGEDWAAVPKASIKAGAKVTVAVQTVMEGFESPTLKRKFDHIAFGTLDSGGGPHAGIGASKPAAAGPVKPLPKAEGPDGRAVAELFAKKAELKGKTVAVRGKVVKFNGGIMGSNWIHLRDGSGSEAGKDNDITVMSQDSAKVGDTVVARGTVGLDKDLGAGYFYPVIVENAKITASK
jgi:hypothetical protein